MFQFRFWPNNNSRMYVLEGVTPCIQSMQLQAGDTGSVYTFLSKKIQICCGFPENMYLVYFRKFY